MTRALEVTQVFSTFTTIFRFKFHEISKRMGVPEEGVAG
jgi:hypothetical protein